MQRAFTHTGVCPKRFGLKTSVSIQKSGYQRRLLSEVQPQVLRIPHVMITLMNSARGHSQETAIMKNVSGAISGSGHNGVCCTRFVSTSYHCPRI